LKAIGFISSEKNEKYISTKGMGGLFFIAHQNLCEKLAEVIAGVGQKKNNSFLNCFFAVWTGLNKCNLNCHSTFYSITIYPIFQ